jgi:hypothetical protein
MLRTYLDEPSKCECVGGWCFITEKIKENSFLETSFDS